VIFFRQLRIEARAIYGAQNKVVEVILVVCRKQSLTRNFNKSKETYNHEVGSRNKKNTRSGSFLSKQNYEPVKNERVQKENN
jgi:hypothetical protein